MAKKKIDEPFFLTFINLGLMVWSVKWLLSDGEDDKNDVIKAQQQFKAGAIRALEERLGIKKDWPKIEAINELVEKGNLPWDHINNLLNMLHRLKSFDGDNEFRIFIKEYSNLHKLISGLISDPDSPSFYIDGKRFRLDDFPDEVSMHVYDPVKQHWKAHKSENYFNVLRRSHPALKWGADGRFHFALKPRRVKDGLASKAAIYGQIDNEFAQFLVDHYKPGIFAYCKLDGCGKIIIAANNRQYCCDKHCLKAFKKREKKSSDKAEYQRIYGKISKQYYRYKGLKIPLREFIKKKWPPDKLYLYDLFSRFAR